MVHSQCGDMKWLFHHVQYANAHFVYFFNYVFVCLLCESHLTSSSRRSVLLVQKNHGWHLPPNGLLCLFIFHCGSHFVWGAQFVLPWLRAVCLSPYRGHEDKLMSKRLLFFIFIYFFVRLRTEWATRSHWRAAATTWGFDVFSCLHWNGGWIPETDLIHGLQQTVFFFF